MVCSAVVVVSVPRGLKVSRKRVAQRTVLVCENLKCFRRKHTTEAYPSVEPHIHRRINDEARHRHQRRTYLTTTKIKVKSVGLSGPRRWGKTRKRVAQRTVLVREQRSFRLSPIFAVESTTKPDIVIKAKRF